MAEEKASVWNGLVWPEFYETMDNVWEAATTRPTNRMALFDQFIKKAREVSRRQVLDEYEDIFMCLVYHASTAKQKADAAAAMRAFKGRRPLYLLKTPQSVSPHYMLACGVHAYHLTGLGVCSATGHYKTFPLTRENWSSIELVGMTRMTHGEIDAVCSSAAKGSNHLSLRNCQNFALRCARQICDDEPNLQIDLSVARTTQALFDVALQPKFLAIGAAAAALWWLKIKGR